MHDATEPRAELKAKVDGLWLEVHRREAEMAAMREELAALRRDAQKLDQMRSRLGRRINVAARELAEARREAMNYADRVQDVGGAVRVTDHAVVRYLERVHGIDMDEIRREVAAWVLLPEARAVISERATPGRPGVVTVLPRLSEPGSEDSVRG